jgi:pyruvate dehydrogenase complex dehydrogenase (E1) component
MTDEFKQQLPDADREETREWIDALDSLMHSAGKERTSFILYKVLKRARMLDVGIPPLVNTRYINTISPEQEPPFAGDERMELRIRRMVRWNAAVMVLRANERTPGLGGHLSTYASSASLYEVGFNHFFRGKDDGQSGDQIFFQGHGAPGVYARAFLEGRFTEKHLDNFRREVAGEGLSSYPHPRLMPNFWEFPTVSMGLGPLTAIHQARFNRYLLARGIKDTSTSRVWAFVGDGEMDEPESTSGLGLAGREGLDNLTFVVNCNLQRLDGPVRGNGKIIQELESTFRGAGWNVIKVIWSRDWDSLLANDVDGVLVNKMNETLDGEWQRYSIESGAYIREHFFGPDERLKALVAHLPDDALRKLRRGGHDYKKLYAAYKAATEHVGRPTAILAKTVKGWTLGEGTEARNITHQVKHLSITDMKSFRDRLELPIPDSQLDEPPYYHPGPKSEEIQYLMERRRALGGFLPRRVVRAKPLTLPGDDVYRELLEGTQVEGGAAGDGARKAGAEGKRDGGRGARSGADAAAKAPSAPSAASRGATDRGSAALLVPSPPGRAPRATGVTDAAPTLPASAITGEAEGKGDASAKTATATAAQAAPTGVKTGEAAVAAKPATPREASTTMAFVRLLRELLRDPSIGKRIVPIIPDEARTFGMESLFREIKIYSSVGQLYEPVDSKLLLRYAEAKDGQILEEGINEAGSMTAFTAAGTSYATHGEHMIPFYIFYSMFGFQRTGDLAWAFGDARGRGFLLGATAGRTTLNGEGLQHQDGHSHTLASTIPNCLTYDPAWSYEMATIVRDGLRRMIGDGEDIFYYLTLYNENTVMPRMPEGAEEGILRGVYRFRSAPGFDAGEARGDGKGTRSAAKGGKTSSSSRGARAASSAASRVRKDGGRENARGKSAPRAQLFGSGTILRSVIAAQEILVSKYGVAADVWSATSYGELRRDALGVERWNRLHPESKPRVPYIVQALEDAPGPVIAASDYMKAVADRIARWVVGDGRAFIALGTDGYGRSDTRPSLRRHFEIDAESIVVATLAALARSGEIEPRAVAKAIRELDIDPEKIDPLYA